MVSSIYWFISTVSCSMCNMLWPTGGRVTTEQLVEVIKVCYEIPCWATKKYRYLLKLQVVGLCKTNIAAREEDWLQSGWLQVYQLWFNNNQAESVSGSNHWVCPLLLSAAVWSPLQGVEGSGTQTKCYHSDLGYILYVYTEINTFVHKRPHTSMWIFSDTHLIKSNTPLSC